MGKARSGQIPQDIRKDEVMKIDKETIFSKEAPKGRGPFPQAVRFGNQIFVSGQGPLDPVRNEPDTGSFEHEVRLTIQNLQRIVKAANSDLSDALKLTVYLSDIENVPKFNKIYSQYFREPLPARTLVQAGLRGIQVEIDGIFACRNDSEGPL